jgi:hypothetical protein
MRKFYSFLSLLIIVSFTVTACNPKPLEMGASSPKALFEKMKKVDGGNLADIVDFVAPDELPLISFSMDMTVTMITSMGKGDMTSAEYQKIRKKYGLPELDKKAMRTMGDPAKAQKIATEKYSNINHRAFIAEVQKIIGKDKGVKKRNNVEDAEFKDVEITGNRAVVFIKSREKGIETIKMKKVANRWYLSLKDMYKR